jgi:penicillin amidase
VDGQSRELEIVGEQIRVKGGETVTRTNRFTHRGPVISSFKGIEDRVISMRWIGNEPSNEVRTVFLLNRAGNLDEFRDAVKTFVSIGQNIVYGDVHGDIGLFTCGGIPVSQGNRDLIMPGDTSLYDWQEILPFDRLPREVNPEKGFLISANNRTTGPEYPYYISHWYSLPARHNRIHELLSAKEVYTPDDMADIQADQTSLWARRFMPVIRSQLDREELQGQALAMYNIFRDWDGNMDANMVEPTIFEAFYLKLVESVFLDELGEELYNELLGTSQLARNAIWESLGGRELSWTDNINTEEPEGLEDLILPSWEAAGEWLSQTCGDDMETWIWGDLHRITFSHPLGSVGLLKKIFSLSRGPFRVGGSYHTVSPYSYNLLDPFNSNHGASQRHIFSSSDWDDSRVIIPTGISGIPASDFYCNQSDMYIRHEYMQELFSRERVIENSVYKSTYIAE